MSHETSAAKSRSVAASSWIALLVLASALGLAAARAGTSAAPASAGDSRLDNKYIGADKCKSCHGAPEGGDQYGKWKTTLHAKAFHSLSSDAAKAIGTARGIADVSKADECVRCHVTAFGVPETDLKKGFDRTQGIQCEVCHGPGEAHMKARFAAAAKASSGGAPAALPAGEIVAVPGEQVCKQCHNEASPSYKPFCYHEFSAQIRHLDPRKGRKTLELGPCSCPKCAAGCPESCKQLARVE
jgi:hypothetical protein